jgi:D-glycerate 3-kinase
MNRAWPEAVAALRALVEASPQPVVLAICGAQGSGKSTLAAALASALQAQGKRCAVLSLDDFYHTKAHRIGLASTLHPLCITRGPPGTHDVGMALAVLDRLRAGEAVALPRFDKPHDDRVDPVAWPVSSSHCDVIIFEGWCVGARAQSDAALAAPVNALEAEEDADGAWRAWSNRALAGPYQQLFARPDRLVLLAAPDFAVVHGWRLQQEEEAGAGMDAVRIARFIAHYERLTRHILAEMPGRADLVIRLGPQRQVLGIERPAMDGSG